MHIAQAATAPKPPKMCNAVKANAKPIITNI